MTREEARKAAEVMLAYADGKEVQVRDQGGWGDCNSPSFNWDGYSDNYRIKPKPHYRPFKSAEECWAEMQRHQPFGWVRDKGDGHYVTFTCVNEDKEDNLVLNGNYKWPFEGAMRFFTFADGTPFGMMEE